MFKIIQKRKIWYILSSIIIIPGIIIIATGGLKLGIDFSGGSLIRVAFNEQKPSVQQIEEALTNQDLGTIKAQPLGENEMTIRLKNIDNDRYQEILLLLNEKFGSVEEKSFESIGPTIGEELRKKAIIAIILVLVFIILYISFVFRKMSGGTVKSWVYGLGALVALFHDILIVVGFFAILGKFWNVEIDILFITALLTVLGFSVHDTIVVYDRIRERLKISYNKTFEETVNESVNQTLIRSINTSLTTLLVLLALYLFGGESIRFFMLALIVGIIAGTYSSIFVASPFLVTWKKIIEKGQ
jgi:preprotein translocase subunit SecF